MSVEYLQPTPDDTPSSLEPKITRLRRLGSKILDHFTSVLLDQTAIEHWLAHAHHVLPYYISENNRSDDIQHPGKVTIELFLTKLEPHRKTQTDIKIQTALFEKAVFYIQYHRSHAHSKSPEAFRRRPLTSKRKGI